VFEKFVAKGDSGSQLVDAEQHAIGLISRLICSFELEFTWLKS